MTLQSVGAGGLSYAQRALNDYNNSLSPASDQSILLALGFLLLVGVGGSIFLWIVLKGKKPHD